MSFALLQAKKKYPEPEFDELKLDMLQTRILDDFTHAQKNASKPKKKGAKH